MSAGLNRWQRGVIAASGALALGLLVLVYRGPGFRITRGHGGDVAIVALLFFGLGVVTRWRREARATLVAVIAVGTELAQLARLPVERSLLTELTIGSTFDPWDLLAYALGLVLAVQLDRGWISREG
jgi:hypothetical protein